jgi:hypothetical protein
LVPADPAFGWFGYEVTCEALGTETHTLEEPATLETMYLRTGTAVIARRAEACAPDRQVEGVVSPVNGGVEGDQSHAPRRVPTRGLGALRGERLSHHIAQR